MPWLDRWVAEILTPLAVWVFLSGLDDLFLDICFVRLWLRGRRRNCVSFFSGKPRAKEKKQRKAAVMIPCWQEHEVIAQMLAHNLSTIEYENYDVWLGVYCNDPETLEKVLACEKKLPRVYHTVCPHPGPTTKADCLNAIFEGIRRHEAAAGVKYEIVQQHDAEDMIPPASLRLANENVDRYDMIQFPVLPLPTGVGRITHGTYCDEFAEFHLKELCVRSELGGFLPSAGVGTAYRREVLDRLAHLNGGEPFDSRSLTEDYFAGLQIHRFGSAQLFVCPQTESGVSAEDLPSMQAKLYQTSTRAYFPQQLRCAIRQRTRWVTGIALQSWQRFGWRVGPKQFYWLWRDRKGLISHPASLLANVIFIYGVSTWLWAKWTLTLWRLGVLGADPVFMALLFANSALLFWRLAVRSHFGYRVYGWGHALMTPLRTPWANLINFCATVQAISNFAFARLSRQPLAWRKTAHSYPGEHVLVARKRRLGEILISMQQLNPGDLEQSLANLPPDQRLGEYLVEKGTVEEIHIQKALGLQQGVSFRKLETVDVQREALRKVPRNTARNLRVLPFRVDETSRLWFASPEVPNDALRNTISRYCDMAQGFILVTPANFDSLLQSLAAQSGPLQAYWAAGD